MVPENAQRPEEVLQFLGLGGNADAISRAQHIVTIGDNDLFPAADGTDQHLDLQGGGDIFEGHAIQQAALRNVVFHQLHPALGEGFHLGDRRKAQDTGDITGSLPLRVDRKRKPHLLLHESQLTFVFHAAHPGNGILGAQLFGGHAGDHIDLILAGSGNDEIRLTGPGLLLHSISGAIALDAQNIQFLRQALRHAGAVIDDGDIVALAGEMLRQGPADLSDSDNYDPHNVLPWFWW